MDSGVADPPGLGVELEQVLGDDQTQQLGIGKLRLPAADVSSGPAEPGQNLIIEEDVQCGQDGVEVGFHTQGFTPSAND